MDSKKLTDKNYRLPMIGVLPLVDEEKESYWMLPGYMKGIQRAGGIPFMLPLTTDNAQLKKIADCLDGFLFTGGHDVSPYVYHEQKMPYCGICCPSRDEMEYLLLQYVLDLDKPVLGICRGIQLINAVLGGTLYQDLPKQHPSGIEHHQNPPYDRPIHSVSIVRESPLYTLLNKEQLYVNSYHHQAVRELAKQLRPMAFSEDGLIEAVYLPGVKFLWAVQWHPEFSYLKDEDSQKIFDQFTNKCRLF